MKLIFAARAAESFGFLIQLVTVTVARMMLPFACLLVVFLLAFTLMFAVLDEGGAGGGDGMGDGGGDFGGLVNAVYELPVNLLQNTFQIERAALHRYDPDPHITAKCFAIL